MRARLKPVKKTSSTSSTPGPFHNPVVFSGARFRPCGSKTHKWECGYHKQIEQIMLHIQTTRQDNS